MLNPLHLRTLGRVLETGSFAVAARQLGYTPSAVSQQIATLERAVRLPLFERDARSIRPTPAAAFLATRGQEVLSALGFLQDDLRAWADGIVGTVRLGSFPTAGRRLLPAALAALGSASPAVEIVLDEGEPDELAPRVRDGDLDAALVHRYSRVPRRPPSALSVTPLLREDLVLLLPAGHRLAGAGEVRLDELADATWVGTRHGTDGATCLRRMCAEADFEPRVSYRSNDYDVVRGFVRSGLGIAIVPALAHVPDTGVVPARLVGVEAHRHVEVLTRTGRHDPAVHRVVTALHRSARALHDPAASVVLEASAASTGTGRAVSG
ncbi:LysR family transcriptional regulator [Geodermatophilus sp. YIM 151500]|uniref:LysR family transcriptional regulator n=1 Tax=Geodermatophilus sp. YIM 151500 TaxID=2984531 RepID=UPI0021E47E61|nr:LysR family transcriptional regulator [Geodermatophilus sp. YIM 151500]MCV2490967.1 LysR family transcriptional regulator [Geodermatophilus sp. YIM 151500]